MSIISVFLKNLRRFPTFVGRQLERWGQKLQSFDKEPEAVDPMASRGESYALVVHIDFSCTEGYSADEFLENMDYEFRAGHGSGYVDATEIMSWQER